MEKLSPKESVEGGDTALIRQCLIQVLHTNYFYTLPFYYGGHAISKTVYLSSLAFLLPVQVSVERHNREINEKWILKKSKNTFWRFFGKLRPLYNRMILKFH